MNGTLTIDLAKTYKKKQVSEFESGRDEIEEILLQPKVQEFAEKGFIRLAAKKRVVAEIPPKFPGKPLSEYLKEIRE